MPGITGCSPPDAALAFAESLLGPLIEHDIAGRGDLVNSLRAWLAHHGQWDPSAAALGVHRHTLRHRMNTVEELLGRSLDSPGRGASYGWPWRFSTVPRKRSTSRASCHPQGKRGDRVTPEPTGRG